MSRKNNKFSVSWNKMTFDDLVEIETEKARRRMEAEEKRLSMQRIKAIETMEAEKNPKIKRRMRMLIDDGVYDFTGIRDF